jgi:3-oxoacyl-[acyl-carrier protein] reductase
VSELSGRVALDGRVALVTGGSRGIGRAIVRRLAASGAGVIFTYRADEAAAQRLVAEVAENGGRAAAVACDFSLPTAVRDLFMDVDHRIADLAYDGIDVLVNNAGIALSKPFGEVTEADYDHVMTVNARSVFFMMQYALARLNDSARIINISSISTTYVSGGEAVYAASKAAVEQFGRAAARELGKRKITVNTVAPGVIDTDLTRASMAPEMLQGMEYMTPLGRLGTPEDVAATVLLLASPLAGWLTGQHVRADGGLM